MTNEPLSSWNDTPTRAAIVDFVDKVTDPTTDWFVPEEDRVVVFDNDGTLWSEKPMPIQLDFTIRRFAEMAEEDPSLQDQQPWKAAHEKDFQWFGEAMVKHYHGDDGDLKMLMGAISKAFAALSIGDYSSKVTAFFETAD
ncbi:MAG TPA: haloacid dehalogenase-like hydrolase, partial [Acidimicrobiia bacterium]